MSTDEQVALLREIRDLLLAQKESVDAQWAEQTRRFDEQSQRWDQHEQVSRQRWDAQAEINNKYLAQNLEFLQRNERERKNGFIAARIIAVAICALIVGFLWIFLKD